MHVILISENVQTFEVKYNYLTLQNKGIFLYLFSKSKNLKPKFSQKRKIICLMFAASS